MAQVTIYRDEARAEDLPPLCIVCGEESDLTRVRNFKWQPSWPGVLILLGLIGMIAYAVVSAVLTKRMRVEVPLCFAHTNHWSWRLWAIWGGLGALAAVTSVGVTVCVQFNLPAPYPGVLAAATLSGFFAWAVAALAIQHRAVRPKRITDDFGEFRSVHGAFAAAHRDLEAEREEAYRRRAARSRRDREYD